MVVIFSASTDAMSIQRTSRIIGPLLRWLHPTIRPETVQQVQFLIRKGAHMAEYAVLAVLIFWALRNSRSQPSSGWSWRLAGLSWCICTLYAASDEFHQSFTRSRMGSSIDVMIDAAGAVMGLLLVWSIGRLARQW